MFQVKSAYIFIILLNVFFQKKDMESPSYLIIAIVRLFCLSGSVISLISLMAIPIGPNPALFFSLSCLLNNV